MIVKLQNKIIKEYVQKALDTNVLVYDPNYKDLPNPVNRLIKVFMDYRQINEDCVELIPIENFYLQDQVSAPYPYYAKQEKQWFILIDNSDSKSQFICLGVI